MLFQKDVSRPPQPHQSANKTFSPPLRCLSLGTLSVLLEGGGVGGDTGHRDPLGPGSEPCTARPVPSGRRMWGPHILGDEAKILSKKLKLVPKVFLVPLPVSFPVCLNDRKVLLRKLLYTTK